MKKKKKNIERYVKKINFISGAMLCNSAQAQIILHIIQAPPPFFEKKNAAEWAWLCTLL